MKKEALIFLGIPLVLVVLNLSILVYTFSNFEEVIRSIGVVVRQAEHSFTEGYQP